MPALCPKEQARQNGWYTLLIVTAVNTTFNEAGHRVLHQKDGTADYIVEVAINRAAPIWAGSIKGHVRDSGASQLLRLIADKMDAAEKKKKKK
jgi:hypothetical protein